jgi:hypothetical protein
MKPALIIIVAAAAAMAQDNAAARAAREWRQQHERATVDEFFALLAIPNIARDRDNIQRNAETIARLLEKRGVASKPVSVPGANPVVFAEIRTPGATRTIVFYAHYDGQPNGGIAGNVKRAGQDSIPDDILPRNLLEVEPQRKLQVARQVRLAGDHPELAGGCRKIRRREVRVIDEIVRLGAELESCPLVHDEFLEQR